MKKWMLVHIMLFFCFCYGATAQSQENYIAKCNRYIEQHKALAVAEQQRSGVPAAITLGQGILETSAGCSELMTKANNHFGIKCKKEWRGETFAHTDDAPNECFRKYNCAMDSYKDHSDYLRSGTRYAALFQLQATDYSGWAYGLKRCGYATNPRYAQQLIKIIEDFHLQDYTYIAMNEGAAAQPVAVAVVPQQRVYRPAETTDAASQSANGHDAPDASSGNSGVTTVNGLRAFYAHKGDMLLEAAIRYKMRYARLLEINDLPDAPLEADMFVYLEKKNTKGAHSSHIMQPGETLLQVAQAEGMQLKQLRTYNQLGTDETPAMGTVLQLQEPGSAKPEIAAGTTINTPVSQEKNDETVYIYKKKTQQQPAAVVPAPVASQDVVADESAAPQKKIVAEEKVQPAPTPAPRVAAASVPAVQRMVTPPPPVRRTEPVADQPFNIANEKAVEETVVRNNPRYIERGDNNEPAVVPQKETPATAPVTESKVTPVPVKEQVTAPAAPAPVAAASAEKEAETAAPAAEPQDDLERLKAKLDKVVYAQGNKTKMTSASQVPVDTKPALVTTAQVPVTPEASAAGDDKFYTVQKGDTAFSIAKRNGVSMKQLMDWNHLNFENIKTGQKLRVKP
ncbi:glucosaminidase domain-containing protein [Chitinophagaceae bacterium MMS25-I14]